MIARLTIFLFFAGFGLSSCEAQTFKYVVPPTEFNTYRKFVPVPTGNAVDISSELFIEPYSIKRDYTKRLQLLLDKYKKIILPDQILFINDSGLQIPSDSEIYFRENTKINMLASSKTHFDILKIYDVHNVKIYNAVIEGDRKSHIGSTGEWAAGISLRNAVNVEIKYAKISNTWGDGLFIGSESGGVSENIKISNVDIDYARRNGVSVTSGKKILLENFLISNTSGTAPMCGVDIEPSLPQEYLTDINLINFTTFNNDNGGMNVNTSVMTDDIPRTISIYIEGHRDFGSSISFGYSINANDKSGRNITGKINYKNAQWNNPKHMEYWKTPNMKKIDVIFENVMIKTGNSRRIINDQNF